MKDVWLLLGPGAEEQNATGELVTAFPRFFSDRGDRAEVRRTAELLPGVRGGRLELRGLDGEPVEVPRVVYARLSTPTLSTDREITLLRHLELMGAVLVNPVRAFLTCVNKFWQLQELARAGLPVKDTTTYVDAPWASVIDAGVPEPCVVKRVRGNKGQGVFLVSSAALLRDLDGSLRDGCPYVFQTYEEYSRGRDLRVVVVDGRPVASVVRRARRDTFKANISQGGEVSVCTGRFPDAEKLAVRAAAAVGADVAGVDLLFTPDGTFTVCEVNANMGWRPEMTEVTPAVLAACAARLDARE
ncbi:RimK family alpha-L-glutamate ligase [Streptomyces roseirectus]|uniref:RimK family alpha-L-glutamate ligase n=1 Tax=Streptomyces roseirectus TaxID=2768066 RepID=A0A7H0I7U6_9ACTN|nr:RimK family alpha-L-glutamate ligase [Streptomyces roseirectus]QNP68862.1 RimK family alpha-L-glutamate ligase [Streptomyces roseirectus]